MIRFGGGGGESPGPGGLSLRFTLRSGFGARAPAARGRKVFGPRGTAAHRGPKCAEGTDNGWPDSQLDETSDSEHCGPLSSECAAQFTAEDCLYECHVHAGRCGVP